MKQFPKALIVACLLCGACGGGGGGERAPTPTPDRPPSPAPDGPSNPGTVIRGSERLGWDQPGGSQSAVQAFTYNLYVDGVARTLADVRCTASTNATGYPCSGQLPALSAGAHTLELAAVDQGVEGPRSAPFRVTVVLSSSALEATSEEAPFSKSRVVCLDAGVDDCYHALTIATTRGAVADLTVTPDERLFFVEDGRAVRVGSMDGLSSTAALVAPDDRERIVSLAIGPDFLQTRFVFVGSTEERRGGAEFTVRRYREVGGALGQGAALVTGLPVPDANARVPIAVDESGRLYVALPAADESVARLSASAYNGYVLRFAADGSVPGDQTSPILARGYPQASAILYEAAAARLWLAGSSRSPDAPVSVMSVDSSRSDSRPAAIAMADHTLVNLPAAALRNRGGSIEVWLADGKAYRGAVSGNSLQRLRLVETGLGELTGIATSPRNELIVAVREAAGTELVRLVSRTPSLSQ